MEEKNIVNWNLPPWIVYTPGAPLSLVIILSNPEALPRQYAVILRLWQNGQMLFEQPLTVEGEAVIPIESGETLLAYNSTAIPATDGVLELSVLDAATAEYLASVTTELLGEISAPVTQMTSVLPMVGTILLTGVMMKELGGGSWT